MLEALETLERTFARQVFTGKMSSFGSIGLKSKPLCYCYLCERVSYLNIYSSLSGEVDVVTGPAD